MSDVEYYLRPRRGTNTAATRNAIVLKSGEVYFEVPDSGVGTGVGKIKMGDGKTRYGALPYFLEQIDVTNTNIEFTPSTSSSNSTLLNEITSGATLATIIGSIKTLLTNLDSSITDLNVDINNLLTSVSAGYFDKDSVLYSTRSSSATFATSSTRATSATISTSATRATSATFSTSATIATSATRATSANRASTAAAISLRSTGAYKYFSTVSSTSSCTSSNYIYFVI